MKKVILAIALTGAAFAQYPTSIYTPPVAKDNIATTLSSAMLAGDTVAVVADGAGWAANMYAYICDSTAQATAGKCAGTFEVMLVTNATGNVLNLTRAQGGTSAIAHAKGRAISNSVTAIYNSLNTAEILALETALGTRAIGQRQELGYSSQNAANEPRRNPLALWELNSTNSFLTGQEWDNIYNPATSSCSQIVVLAGTATATCNGHGLTNGAGFIIGGFPPEHIGLYGNAVAASVTTNTFQYSPFGIADGTYTDAGVWVIPSLNNATIKAHVFAKTYNPPTSLDASNFLALSTGAFPAFNVYHQPERRPLGYNDYSMTPSSSAMEAGSSGPGSTIYAQPGISNTDPANTYHWAFDTYTPWSIANTKLTSIAYVNTTNVATIILNASAFAPWLYETVTVGTVFTISGATVDANLNGDYEVQTKTDRNHFTARKIPVPGFVKAATATYTDAGLNITPEPYYSSGSISPWLNSGVYAEIRNAISQGFLVTPMHLLDPTRFPYLAKNDGWAYSVGQKNFNGPTLAKRFGVTYHGTVWGWRGQIPDGFADAMQPLSGVSQVPDPAIVTVANTTAGTALKTLTQIELGYLTVGKAYRIKAWGIYSSAGGGSDVANVYLASITDSVAYVGTNSASGAATNAGWSAEWNVIIASAGAAGTANVNMVGTFNATAFSAGTVSPVAVNTNIRQQWQIAMQWGAASASNSLTVQGLTVEVLN